MEPVIERRYFTCCIMIASMAESCTRQKQETARNKEVKQMGARITHPRPAPQISTPLMSVTAIATVIIGDGPGDILRACHHLIDEAAVLILGDHFDAAAATCIHRNRSAIR